MHLVSLISQEKKQTEGELSKKKKKGELIKSKLLNTVDFTWKESLLSLYF